MDGDGFRDRNQRYSYLLACENARRIRLDPSRLDRARAHLARFSKGDPHQRHAYALWIAMLNESPDVVAERLTKRSVRGDYLRETAPSFGGLPNPIRTRLLSLARQALATTSSNGA